MAKAQRTTTARGLGWDHQRERARLFRDLRDGTPCYWCGKGMYHTPDRNWDGRTLNADHDKARAHGGTKASRLLHDTCNKQRGTGDRDHLRPAVTGIWPPVKHEARFDWGPCTPAAAA